MSTHARPDQNAPDAARSVPKLTARHKVLFASACALFLAVAGFAAWMSVRYGRAETALRAAAVQRQRADAERDAALAAQREAQRARPADAEQLKLAERRRQSAERVAEFMSETLAGTEPSVALGRDATMLREMMGAAAKRIKDGELKAAPEAELRCRLMIGKSYRQLAAYDAAEAMLRPAVELARAIHGEGHAGVAESLSEFAMLLKSRGQAAEALPKYEEALDMTRRLSPGDDPLVATGMDNLASCLRSLGRPAEALSKYQGALEMRQRLFAGEHPAVARSLNNVASCLWSLGRPAEALPKYEAALQMCQRAFAGDHPDVAGALNNVAYCLQSLGRSAESLPKYRAAVEMRQRLYAVDHPEPGQGLDTEAEGEWPLGGPAEALPKYEAAVEMHQRLYGSDHPAVARALSKVAYCLRSLGRSAEALPRYKAALEIRQRLSGGDHADVATSLNDLAFCLQSLGRLAEALSNGEQALAMRMRILPPDHIDLRVSEALLGAILAESSRLDEAEPLLLNGHAALVRSSARQHAEYTRHACISLVRLYDSRHVFEPDEGYDVKAAEWRSKLDAWRSSTQLASSPAETNQTAASPPVPPLDAIQPDMHVAVAPLVDDAKQSSETAVDAADFESLTERLGERLAVEGIVDRVSWTVAQNALNLEFEGPEDTRLLGWVPPNALVQFNDRFNGDFAGVIEGKRVRVTGSLQRYGGRKQDWSSRLQITLQNPSQLQILEVLAQP